MKEIIAPNWREIYEAEEEYLSTTTERFVNDQLLTRNSINEIQEKIQFQKTQISDRQTDILKLEEEIELLQSGLASLTQEESRVLEEIHENIGKRLPEIVRCAEQIYLQDILSKLTQKWSVSITTIRRLAGYFINNYQNEKYPLKPGHFEQVFIDRLEKAKSKNEPAIFETIIGIFVIDPINKRISHHPDANNKKNGTTFVYNERNQTYVKSMKTEYIGDESLYVIKRYVSKPRQPEFVLICSEKYINGRLHSNTIYKKGKLTTFVYDKNGELIRSPWTEKNCPQLFDPDELLK